ncbi:MAG TPA: hypothetical protein VK588_10115 [Chitinophagaceae bacterium]|nr:hypothetical protein [Chitinophagaceae bacterium]
MKGILFAMFISNALIIFSLSSCKKETILPGSIANPIQHYPITINNVVAGRWTENEKGIYVSIIKDVLAGTNTNNRSVKIYLIADGKETQINQSITFMKGKLWAVSTNTDIEIDYLPDSQIFPFSYLVIKVVIE